MRKIAPIKKDTQKETALSSSEIEILKISTSSLRNKAIISFLASTCCRISEICQANINDVDFEKREVLVHGKGNKDRIVYLDDVSIYYLQEYLKSRTDNEDALFVNQKGEATRIKRNSIERMFARLGEQTNIDGVHPHRFRRTGATFALRRGMPIELVSKLLGHESIETTRIYLRKTANEQQAIVDKIVTW